MKTERLFRVYPELRTEAVRLLDMGHSASIIAEKLGVSDATLYQWRVTTLNQSLLRESESYKEAKNEVQSLINDLLSSEPQRARRGRPPLAKKDL